MLINRTRYALLKGATLPGVNPQALVYVCNISSNNYMECRIAGVRLDLDVAVLNILDDEIDDNNDDKNNDKDGGKVIQGIQGSSPSSFPSRDIVRFVLKLIYGKASHHYRQSLWVRTDRNNRSGIGPQLRCLIRRWRKRSEESTWSSRHCQLRRDKGMHIDRRCHKPWEFRWAPIWEIFGLTRTDCGPKKANLVDL